MKHLIVICLSLFPWFLQAQESSDTGRVSLRVASVTQLPAKEYYLLANDEEPLKIEVSSWQLSEKVKVRSGKKYFLSTKIPNLENNESLASHSVCHFVPTESARDIIGIMFKRKNKSGKYDWKLHQLSGDRTDFKAGQRKVFNLSKYRVRMKYAGSVVNIPPGKSKNLKVPQSLKGDFIPVLGLFLANPQKTKWRRFLSSRWTANPHTRSIIFIYPEPSTKSLSYHGLDDSLNE